MAAASQYRLGVVYTRGMPVFGFERVCIGVEGKAGMRRSSRTTASISNVAIRVKVRAMEAENWCAVGITAGRKIALVCSDVRTRMAQFSRALL